MRIRESLCVALGLPANGLEIASYPTGPQFRHTYWWRDHKVDYAEAQFVAAISHVHPVLSLGVSVEKGLEGGTATRPERAMDRRVWDWPRLVDGLSEILLTDVPAVAGGQTSEGEPRIQPRSLTSARDPKDADDHEHVGVDSIFEPPLFLALDVPVCRLRESE